MLQIFRLGTLHAQNSLKLLKSLSLNALRRLVALNCTAPGLQNFQLGTGVELSKAHGDLGLQVFGVLWL